LVKEVETLSKKNARLDKEVEGWLKANETLEQEKRALERSMSDLQDNLVWFPKDFDVTKLTEGSKQICCCYHRWRWNVGICLRVALDDNSSLKVISDKAPKGAALWFGN
jgi:hypothetical protein